MSKMTAVLKVSRLSVAKKIEKARHIVLSMNGNPAFPEPNPSLAAVTAAINTLEAARLAALSGGTDQTALMHTRAKELETQLMLLAAYVTSIAAVSPATAEAVILSAGMEVKTTGGPRAAGFEVRSTGIGEIKITLAYMIRSVFVFQMSTDPGSESSWQTIYEGTRSRIRRSGLVSGTRYFFRATVIGRNGRGPWTEPLSSVAL